MVGLPTCGLALNSWAASRHRCAHPKFRALVTRATPAEPQAQVMSSHSHTPTRPQPSKLPFAARSQVGQVPTLMDVGFRVGYLSMERIFTAWQSSDGSQITLIAGEGPPTFANGELQPDCDVMLWRIAAGSWEEAAAIRNLRLGWEPYVPSGKAAPCPIAAPRTIQTEVGNAGIARARPEGRQPATGGRQPTPALRQLRCSARSRW